MPASKTDDKSHSFKPLLPLTRTMFPRTSQSLAEFVPEPEVADIDVLAILGDKELPNYSPETFELFKRLEEE